MINFFILPYEPTQWKTAASDLMIDPVSYRKKLQHRWPEAKINESDPNSTYLLRWQLDQGDEIGSSGELQRNQQIVSIQPVSRQSLLEFVLWHREFIPTQFRLFLTWEESWESIELKPKLTDKDLRTVPLL